MRRKEKKVRIELILFAFAVLLFAVVMLAQYNIDKSNATLYQADKYIQRIESGR